MANTVPSVQPAAGSGPPVLWAPSCTVAPGRAGPAAAQRHDWEAPRPAQHLPVRHPFPNPRASGEQCPLQVRTGGRRCCPLSSGALAPAQTDLPDLNFQVWARTCFSPEPRGSEVTDMKPRVETSQRCTLPRAPGRCGLHWAQGSGTYQVVTKARDPPVLTNMTS